VNDCQNAWSGKFQNNLLNVYVVHSPTNALFINLVKSFKIYIKIHNNIAPTCVGL